MTNWLRAHSRRFPTTRIAAPAKSVDAIAATPKIGQAQPKTSGSGTSVRAIAGTKVAGMM